jgi:hypothetical protein
VYVATDAVDAGVSRGAATAGAKLVVMAALALTLTGCGASDGRSPASSAAPAPAAANAPGGEALFEERAVELGVDFVHSNGAAGDHHMPEILGAGAALFDYDGDGDLDLYLVQSGAFPTGSAGGGDAAARDRLYRSELIETGALRFVDVTEESRIDARGYGMAVATGDYDGDGHVDLYVGNFGSDQLWRNRGDGTFEDATEASGASDAHWSTAATFFDYDGDRRLDLFVGSYVELPGRELRCHSAGGAPDYCGPLTYPPAPDRLYRNRGDGSFEDVSAAARIALTRAATLGVVATDFDADGRQDLYVANDAYANRLWINQGDGSFLDRAELAGCAVGAEGLPQGSMGVDAGDHDGDGLDDLLVTNIDDETNTLYRAAGPGSFEDATFASGLGAPSRGFTGFGTAWIDVENDGALDLLIANGAVRLRAAAGAARSPYAQRAQLFRNQGDGRFVDLSRSAAAVFATPMVGRGAAFGDLDDDGDLDAVVTNNGDRPWVLINRAGQRSRWLGLRLYEGVRDAYGARAGLRLADGRTLWRRVRADGSYASASDPRVLFGLGAGGAPAGLVVTWPDGERTEYAADAVTVGRYTVIARDVAATASGGAQSTGEP